MASRIFQFFLFTSLFITGCALLMVHQTNQLFSLQYSFHAYFGFVAASTLCSYNFHWWLTPASPSENLRIRWTQQHKTLHLVLFFAGAFGSAWYFVQLLDHWEWLLIGAGLTFLYSAPKLPHRPFRWLQTIAIGKTIFLAFVWTYVTSFLPVALDGAHFTAPAWLFVGGRFFLIYAICIPFDYRDRDYDRQEGIRSMITWFSEQGINRLFYGSIILFAACTLAMAAYGFSWPVLLLLLLPGGLTALLFPRAKKDFSDYLYYFALDGLMALSALLTTLLRIL
ncbi:MAG: UbiA family prenyltransferase [Candidatus Pseudobacter hemicellulosilyticus]|uniref:UbiA family prenyltransferase n=1 Tax=Candidatus Pseudobacter hemicellulosilyticus TaxID=3121375 RepID=A0AAJ6BJS4_9BACT|nr:MAG: UbiA family prenyltransferase [Pseudobacter sp.]